MIKPGPTWIETKEHDTTRLLLCEAYAGSSKGPLGARGMETGKVRTYRPPRGVSGNSCAAAAVINTTTTTTDRAQVS